MLPAGQRADPADGGVNGANTSPIALPPDHALMISRRDFPPLQHQATIVVENQLRVVERAAVALIDPDHQHHPVLRRRFRQAARSPGPAPPRPIRKGANDPSPSGPRGRQTKSRDNRE